MGETITLTGDYGYDDYKLSSWSDGGTIDATDATWIVANSRNANPDAETGRDTGDLQLNLYPVQIVDADQVRILGGTILGEVPLDSDWTYTYRDDYPDGASGNSAALRVDDSLGASIEGWRIDRPWDGIRVSGDSDGFTISDVWISRSRDDAVENDDVLSGTIRDSLFDGVFSGISLGDSNAPSGDDNLVTLDGVLLRSESFLYKGDVTHGSPMKMSKDDDISPNLRIIDTVFAIEDVDHFGQERLQMAWDKTVESRGNVFLNLSDDRLADDYPLPGSGWKILEGQEARDYWESVASDWKAAHPDDGADPRDEAEPDDDDVAATPPEQGPDDVAPTPSEPEPDVEPAPSARPSDYNLFRGTERSEYLKGTDEADVFRSGGGEVDTIYGYGGADVLVFGAEVGDGEETRERFKDFDLSEDIVVLELGAQIERIKESDDRLSIKLEGDGDMIYLYADNPSANDVNFVYADGLWIA